MFRSFELTFSEVCQSFIKESYDQASIIVEYGSGGSTMYGAENSKKVITVESDSRWLLELMGAYKEQNLPGDIVPLWANIGETKEWGYPSGDTQWRGWPEYAALPWRFCEEHVIDPDLVLIDGRFRVACFLASCVHIRKPTTIIIDDFAERPEYHLIKKLQEPVRVIDDRMAVFEVEPGLVDAKYLLANIGYFYNPE